MRLRRVCRAFRDAIATIVSIAHVRAKLAAGCRECASASRLCFLSKTSAICFDCASDPLVFCRYVDADAAYRFLASYAVNHSNQKSGWMPKKRRLLVMGGSNGKVPMRELLELRR